MPLSLWLKDPMRYAAELGGGMAPSPPSLIFELASSILSRLPQKLEPIHVNRFRIRS